MQTEFLRKVIGNRMNQKVDNNTPDEKLVELFVKEKDERAFEEIFNRYVNKTYSIAIGITSDRNSAEEVVQEVFLTLINKANTFKEMSKFSTWLYRVTINASIMHIRHEKRHENNLRLENYVPYYEDGSLIGRIVDKDWSNRPDIVIFSKEVMEVLDHAISELPENFRVVFQLRDITELTNEEISEILGISIGAVKSRIHRARLYLRDKISDYFYEWRQYK
jgi:RNA polymerase sigma-70 factor, ECF subfamily